MSIPRRLAPLFAAALVLVASTALAFTIQELLDRGSALDADYADLIDRMEEATPPEHAALEAEAAGLSSDRDQLVADRSTLGSCACSELDSTLSAIAIKKGAVDVIIDAWDD